MVALARRKWVGGLVLVVVLLVTGLAPGQARANTLSKDAQAFIATLADKTVAALTRRDVPRKERVERFRMILEEHFSFPTIARWVLGKYWKSAADEDQAEFLRLFRDLIVINYVDRFTDYHGEILEVLGAEAKGDRYVLVHSRIVGVDGGRSAKVGWWLRQEDGEFKVVDVSVEGISMSTTQRSEFGSFLRGHEGKLNELNAALRKRIEN